MKDREIRKQYNGAQLLERVSHILQSKTHISDLSKQQEVHFQLQSNLGTLLPIRNAEYATRSSI